MGRGEVGLARPDFSRMAKKQKAGQMALKETGFQKQKSKEGTDLKCPLLFDFGMNWYQHNY